MQNEFFVNKIPLTNYKKKMKLLYFPTQQLAKVLEVINFCQISHNK